MPSFYLVQDESNKAEIGRNMPELILYNKTQAVLRCPLHSQTLTIGQNPSNDISLPDDQAAPFLCVIEKTSAGDYVIHDRSGQGIEIDGVKKTDHQLAHGDNIALGYLSAVFQIQKLSKPVRQTQVARRTGSLQKSQTGELTRTDVRLRLPHSHQNRRMDIPEDGLRVGADPENDIVLDDKFTSTFHAQFYRRGEKIFLRDLDSTNGTFVDEVRIMEAEVSAPMRIRFGEETFHLESHQEQEPIGEPVGEGPWICGQMLTNDPEFAQVFQLIEKVAAHDASICILGETGCGKELVALAIHELSGRIGRPFVPLNCAAIPSNLIESVLFGHEMGAFTGADRMQRGVFEEAQNGTLFLDEIGELPLEMQAKLLRVLETRQVRRLGGRSEIDIHVRIVSATHRDLIGHTNEGRFREDLLHRLYVIPIQLPPLRERPTDINFLANHFLVELCPDDEPMRFSPGAEDKLRRHPFPGNIRELKNTIQRAIILSFSATQINESAIQFITTQLQDATESGKVYKKGMTLEDIERQVLQEALQAWGNATKAAQALGLPKTTFWRRATALGIMKKHMDEKDEQNL